MKKKMKKRQRKQQKERMMVVEEQRQKQQRMHYGREGEGCVIVVARVAGSRAGQQEEQEVLPFR